MSEPLPFSSVVFLLELSAALAYMLLKSPDNQPYWFKDPDGPLYIEDIFNETMKLSSAMSDTATSLVNISTEDNRKALKFTGVKLASSESSSTFSKKLVCIVRDSSL